MLNPTHCDTPTCVCDTLYHCTPIQFNFVPIEFISAQALHDTDYTLTIIIRNHALLTTTRTHMFTVDTTPPLTGHVIEGLGSGDIDYQTSYEINAHWLGFFDRESDIAFYKYLFGTECANSTAFSYPLTQHSEAIQTTGNAANWTTPTEGTYYITVVAYNGALQPSNQICSDGLSIDTQAPTINNVIIPGVFVIGGLAIDRMGVWFINTDRTRLFVGECPNVTLLEQDLSYYPIR